MRPAAIERISALCAVLIVTCPHAALVALGTKDDTHEVQSDSDDAEGDENGNAGVIGADEWLHSLGRVPEIVSWDAVVAWEALLVWMHSVFPIIRMAP